MLFRAMTPVMLALLLAGPARGDGGFFYQQFHDVWEPEQAAVVVHDAATGQEQLILRVRSVGHVRDFGWIVPVPSLPEVNEAPAELFQECATMTRPAVSRRGFGCSPEGKRIYAPSGDDVVDIYDQRQIGIFYSMVVASRDASALTDSLTRWGFLHADNRDEAIDMLRRYTDRSWFFAVFRIDSTAVADGEVPGMVERVLPPVRLSFRSAQPVYPLQISALSTRGENEVLLYVCAGHRMTYSGAMTEYANRISNRELAAIRERYPNVAALVDAGDCLTKLRRTFRAEEMTADLALVPAASDAEYRPVDLSGGATTELPLLAGVAALWAAIRLRPGRARRRS